MNDVEIEAILSAHAFGSLLFATDNSYVDVRMELVDLSKIKRIISGELRGLSPEIRINKWKCTVCGEDYEYCKHEVGKIYNNEKCVAQPNNIETVGSSLVEKPRDEKCRIEDLLIIYKDRPNHFIWFGFKLNTINSRFKRLQDAYDSKLITAKALHFFSNKFSIKEIDVLEFT